jgi:hypothetical protein
MEGPMDAIQRFLAACSEEQRSLFLSLNTPAKIQAYLDSIPYRVEDDNCSVLSVFRDGKAHCFDGSLFAAAALRQIGFAPIVMQLLPEDDDDHMLAIYKRHNRLGAIGKSNYAGLRSREPVFSSLRELVMSYFKDFYSLDGLFSLRGYTPLISLKPFDGYDWMTSDAGVLPIVQRLHEIRKIRLFTPEMIADLAPIDPISFQAGMGITNIDGVYKPGASPQKDFGF